MSNLEIRQATTWRPVPATTNGSDDAPPITGRTLQAHCHRVERTDADHHGDQEAEGDEAVDLTADEAAGSED